MTNPATVLRSDPGRDPLDFVRLSEAIDGLRGTPISDEAEAAAVTVADLIGLHENLPP